MTLPWNPLHDIWEACLPDLLGMTDGMIQAYRSKEEARRRYSYAIPSEEAILAIVEGGPVVEVGAGTGYWAKLISNAGGDIVAFDHRPPIEGSNGYCRQVSYFDVQKGDAAVEAASWADRQLLLCWPPYKNPMASNAIKAYWSAGGKRVIYVGEGPHGCTGDYEMFQHLGDINLSLYNEAPHAMFKHIERFDIPTWPAIYDFMSIHERVDS